ncbi:20S proteasome subunit alpha 5 [Nematocida major]|uniref:20S proteasome subunit alpha 5 n=1 Tax=Nematocida major TaxID=1912982 RepID=UPI0020086D15|nr:20S proteasome subunit alpha 5 [Nematocida major]KAH9387363.1 20S proteasome subunit alpha 5 [Nematocida major]
MKTERNVNAYSSDGRIYQLEYAMKAASLGTTTIGVKVHEGVIVVSEKKIVSPLQIPESVKKHHLVYEHCGFAFSGLSGDARTIITKARENAIMHKFVYNERIPIEGVAQYLSSISLNFSAEKDHNKIFSRPFGISILVPGFDTEPRLFSLDPSGTYREYYAKAIGSAAEAVTAELENTYKEDISLEEAIESTLLLLKSVMKDPITRQNCEVMVCTREGVRLLAPEEIEGYLNK